MNKYYFDIKSLYKNIYKNIYEFNLYIYIYNNLLIK